ncbi:efflux pump antibiotic resistance protein, putative [Talaromyces stipitatus ATCC 10500]|uniref:Efflux pump antibiotic resistance protein, putative n=1 Tax=Talaromyces stipitatus (strain ATCC 10500 / CBS 375.48 / QM 6759 / NRRL 1006) TaxID=441959 RepID=B8LV88_TALSN|nr:efflux pump antibiotic resistance protein, putative [Talaromyces stipitatus ATCC 10500]EED23138.1 efflux pump antibiotic resistance protein, putative [Talaromyces stipitatus ATCC 10500]
MAEPQQTQKLVRDEEEPINAEKVELEETTQNLSVEYPRGLRLALILLSLYLSVFLVALVMLWDRTILATAIPKITDEFHSLDDIGWYGSAFLLPASSLVLLLGKLYAILNPKWVFIVLVMLFEIGSALCGAAPNSPALIIGRVVAGLGAAGIFSGAVIILVGIVPLEKRPLYQGLFGAVFAVSSVAGPLLGGVFTDRVSWRWCFYINLPFGGVTLLVLILFLDISRPKEQQNLDFYGFIQRIDLLGTAFFLPSIVCLLLAFEWEGTTYAWGNDRIIALFILAGFFFVAFILSHFRRTEYLTIPGRIAFQRSVAAAFIITICIGSTLMVMAYYIPIWFQVVQGASAVGSGVRLIAMVLAMVVGSVAGGGITFRSGYYTPCMIASTIISAVGCGMISTWKVNSSTGIWVGYQILFGFGLGLGMQQPNMAVQTILPKKDISTGVSYLFFGQSLGGSVFLSIAQNVYLEKLVHELRDTITNSNFNPAALTSAGATQIRNIVPPSILPQVLEIENTALRSAFYIAVATSAFSFLPSLFMEWKSIKNGEGQGEKMKEVAGDANENKDP